MKAIFCILLLFLCCRFHAVGQVYFVDQHFNSAPSVPAGFTGGGGAFGSGTAISNYGRNSPSIQFKVNNQTLTYGPWAGAADQISFFHKALAGSGSSFTVEESADGLTWTTAGTVTAITTGATYTSSLLVTSRYVRLVFTLVSSNYVYVDDLRIRVATNACTDNIQMLELLINGGCGSCEGSEEWLYFDTGGNPLNIGDLELVSQTVSAGGCAYGGNGFGDNLNTNWVQAGSYSALQTTYISNLNAWAACPGVFVPVPSNNVIPAHARVLAFTGATPSAPYNFGAICSIGTIYVLFADQTNCGGKYANSSCSANCDRFITLFNHGTGCVDNQYYLANSVNTSAGNAYIFVAPNIGYTSTATCASLTLDVSVQSFNAICRDGKTVIHAQVISTASQDELMVEKSTDGISFSSWCTPLLQHDGEVFSFECTSDDFDERPGYYRLKMINEDGVVKYSQLVFSECKDEQNVFSAFYNGADLMVKSNQDLAQEELSIYSVTGQLVQSQKITMSAGETITFNWKHQASGVYTLRLNGSNSIPQKICIP